MTKQDALSTFIADKACNCSSNSIANKVIAIQQFFDLNPEINDVESYRIEHVEKWMEHLDGLRLSSISIHIKKFAVQNFFMFLNGVV